MNTHEITELNNLRSELGTAIQAAPLETLKQSAETLRNALALLTGKPVEPGYEKGLTSKKGDFCGADYDPKTDRRRLTKQIKDVFEAMKDGHYLSVEVIGRRIFTATGRRHPETSISAQIRNLRKPEFGSYIIARRKAGEGYYEFAIVNPNQYDDFPV